MLRFAGLLTAHHIQHTSHRGTLMLKEVLTGAGTSRVPVDRPHLGHVVGGSRGFTLRSRSIYIGYEIPRAGVRTSVAVNAIYSMIFQSDKVGSYELIFAFVPFVIIAVVRRIPKALYATKRIAISQAI
jgi:hypothetical protein